MTKSKIEQAFINAENDHNGSPDGYIFWDGNGKIDVFRMYEFFNLKDIKLYFNEDNKWKNSNAIIVKLNDNIVSEINVGYLLSIAKRHIINLTVAEGNAGSIIKSLHENVSFFGDKNLKLLDKIDLDFLEDTREAAYFPFKNGVVEVTKDSIELKKYSDFEQYIWEGNIIQMDFKQISGDELVEKCMFYQFLIDLAKVADNDHTTSRQKALHSAIGYMLHRFKDPSLNKAIVLMDVFKDGTPNGGSGKTLLSTAIGKIRNQSIIDGKSYDQKRWFRLSIVELGTEVLLFDDVKKNFDMEQINPLMTTGMHVQRKHKNDVFIPYNKSPKVIITTNYALNGEGSSYTRRKYEFEVSPTYNANKTPRDKFGKNFFEEWDEFEWILFYNTMFNCIQEYLKKGLVESKPINMKLTKIVNSSSEEFLEFAETRLKIDEELDKKVLYDEFMKEYQDFKYLHQRTFTNWLRLWGDFKDLKVTETHSGYTRKITYLPKKAEDKSN